MAYRADAIADTIIGLARKRRIEVTNLKLQKLLYYAQAWHLVLRDRLLFNEPIEAWVHGPVVPGVFRRFKSYRWDAIDSIVPDIGDDAISWHIERVLDSYGNLSPASLERLTHREDPWKFARAGLPPDEPSHNVIDTEVMKRYYNSQLTNA